MRESGGIFAAFRGQGVDLTDKNADRQVVDDFGREWQRFDQRGATELELEEQFERYFSIFPWDQIPLGGRGFDLGCGSGRWAAFVANRVGELVCIDASDVALEVAKRNLADRKNCTFHVASVEEIPLPEESMDFGYSLGVLHHVPDTAGGIRSCVAKLKPGAPMLLYLYYAFDNRPAWFRALWLLSDRMRRWISGSPANVKHALCDFIAATVYWPLARFSGLAEKLGIGVEVFPLAAYRGMSFYTMRTDALDRFGTRLEQRFTRKEIEKMMTDAGLRDITFGRGQPYWRAVGFKAR